MRARWLTLFLALLSAPSAAGEDLSTKPTCDIPADLPPGPELDSNATLNKAKPSPVGVDIYKSADLRGALYGEVYVGTVTVDPETGSVTGLSSGQLSAQSPVTKCE